MYADISFFLGVICSFLYLFIGISLTTLHILAQAESVITEIVGNLYLGRGEQAIKGVLRKLLVATLLGVLFWPILLLNMLRVYVITVATRKATEQPPTNDIRY